MLLAILNFILGVQGVTAICIGIAGTFIAAALHIVPPRAGIVAFICGGCAFLLSAAAKQFLVGGFTL